MALIKGWNSPLHKISRGLKIYFDLPPLRCPQIEIPDRNSTKITRVHWLIQGHRWKNYGFDKKSMALIKGWNSPLHKISRGLKIYFDLPPLRCPQIEIPDTYSRRL